MSDKIKYAIRILCSALNTRARQDLKDAPESLNIQDFIGLIKIVGHVWGSFSNFEFCECFGRGKSDGVVYFSEVLQRNVNEVKGLSDRGRQVLHGPSPTHQNGELGRWRLEAGQRPTWL